MKIVAIIQTRTGSKRFPKKVLKNIFNEPMFLKCLTRLSRSTKLDQIIVATTTSSKDDIIVKLCEERHIPFFRGSEKDVLGRYYQAALAFGADIIVRITSDCPVIDPFLIDKGISIFLANENIDYLSNTFPNRTFPRGLDFEIMTIKTLEFAYRNDKKPLWREHVTPYIKENVEKLKVINIVIDEDFSSMRLTVDEPPDLELINKIYDHFGHDVFSWFEIVSFLKSNPYLLKINENVKQNCLSLEFPEADKSDKTDKILIQEIDYHKYNPKMVLGTAQLGMNYGIANKTGKPDFLTALKIVETAWTSGIRTFDTAQAYGESEVILGRCLKELGVTNEAKIITKLNPKLDHSDGEAIKKAVEDSLELLKVEKIYGLLIHKEELIHQMDFGLYENLLALKEEGLVCHIGASIYEVSSALKILKYPEIDILEIPANIFDNRFDEILQQQAFIKKVLIYIRSIFLQGLLLQDQIDILKEFDKYKPIFDHYQNVITRYNLDKLIVALNYLMIKYPFANIIFGVERPEQITQIMDKINIKLPDSLMAEISMLSQDVPDELIRPYLWVK